MVTEKDRIEDKILPHLYWGLDGNRGQGPAQNAPPLSVVKGTAYKRQEHSQRSWGFIFLFLT